MFADAGHSILVPSRPGYGGTPLSTTTSVSAFTDVVRSLCEHLGITEIAAVVGVSAGGRTATAMAARHPDLVRRVILQSAVSALPWPDRRTRMGARLVFARATEAVTWAALRTLVRRAPDVGLRILLRDLSELPIGDVLTALKPEHRAELIALFSQMRSGAGFVNDLVPTLDVNAMVSQPTLVIATRSDSAVGFRHAESLVATIPRAELVESRADSHFIWFGDDWPDISAAIRAFLT